MNLAHDNDATKQVLYVEDHPVNVLLMQALFERRPGFQLAVAVDGQQALQMGPALQPSLLLLDLRLPDCHGSTLLPLLRQRFGWYHVPAVAVTAEPGFQSAGTGFFEVWNKPLDLGFVLARLDQLLAPERVSHPSARSLPPASFDRAPAVRLG